MSLDKELVRRHFDRHAEVYDTHTPIQEAMGQRLLAICDHLNPTRILELGCGTGRFTAAIRARWPKADILGIDVADRMICIARERVPNARFECADAESFAAPAVDLVISNATVQWFANPAASLALPTTHLAFSTFAANTFCELRDCFAAIGETNRVLPMASVSEWQTLAEHLGELQRCEVDCDVRNYPDLRSFLDSVRRAGAANAYDAKPLRPSRWRQLVASYPAGIPATYEQLYLLIDRHAKRGLQRPGESATES